MDLHLCQLKHAVSLLLKDEGGVSWIFTSLCMGRVTPHFQIEAWQPFGVHSEAHPESRYLSNTNLSSLIITVRALSALMWKYDVAENLPSEVRI